MPSRDKQPKIDFLFIFPEINKIQSPALVEHIQFVVKTALFIADRLAEAQGIK
jgi:hypothetical protein